mmetsp:Transcript_38456/g.102335  ORF Transcript_38456/g.102335 Transcript_38456/m.102335 type:complete len:224 (-) Transcript_38456:377-1048(-)
MRSPDRQSLIASSGSPSMSSDPDSSSEWSCLSIDISENSKPSPTKTQTLSVSSPRDQEFSVSLREFRDSHCSVSDAVESGSNSSSGPASFSNTSRSRVSNGAPDIATAECSSTARQSPKGLAVPPLISNMVSPRMAHPSFKPSTGKMTSVLAVAPTHSSAASPMAARGGSDRDFVSHFPGSGKGAGRRSSSTTAINSTKASESRELSSGGASPSEGANGFDRA